MTALTPFLPLAAAFIVAAGSTPAPADAQEAAAAEATTSVPAPARSPGWMRPLSPAEIDNTLAIGGEEIDARKVRSRMTVAVKVNGKGPFRFVVDSGADSSVLGRRIAHALALPAGEPATLNSMTESRTVERALVDELTVGPTEVQDLVLPVLEERHIGGEGMLGLDALVEQRLMLDFEKRTISVDDATTPMPRYSGEIVVTARMQRGQLILTQARAAALRVDAVVDTGSEVTIGNTALRDKLVKRRGTKIQTVEITGVTGAKATLEYATVPELRLGPVVLKNVPMAFADVPPFAVFGLSDQPALLLGTDMMENFRRVSLDFRARKVRFQLRKCDNVAVRIGSTAARLGADRLAPSACSR
ncbi:retroviral-like aspartic protease family protein [Tsuneonella dongtanensis]|uniref:retroviral-like aspartic protease family protein n=1 Tax=Tsuneonella dongtanensis TaxID=692370 RepID=UPI0018DE049B|nr:retroviral-like aspartic protease family protein [Tsuneonella dongtanensis]